MKLQKFSRLIKKGLWNKEIRIDEADFDAEFYRASNADLQHFNTPAELYKHYLSHGRAEGRLPNSKAMVSDLESKYGRLPGDFDPRKYVSLHPDLKRARFTDREAIEHYLRHGREEGRPYLVGNYDIFRELYLHGQYIADRDILIMLKDEEFSRNKIITGADVMRSKGLEGGGRWIEEIRLDEFAYLNFSWAGQITTRMGAVDAMLSRGIELIAPLSLSFDFDPAFYRELNPSLSGVGDADCYRDWLFRGLEAGQPGSPRQFFDELDLQLEAFPPSFQWQRYALSVNYPSASSQRWSALRHFVTNGFYENHRLVQGDDAAGFLIALGSRYHRNYVNLSVKAFEAAKNFGELDDSSLQLLGDGYFRLDRWDQAVAAYEGVADIANSAPASFCNAAKAAVRLGKFDHAFEILKKGADGCAAIPEWRGSLREAVEAEFDASMSKARDLLEHGYRRTADQILTDAAAKVARRFTETDPIGVPLPVADDDRVLMLANVDSPQCTHYRVDQKRQMFEILNRTYQIFPVNEVEDFISALPGASAAIFFRLPARPMTIRAIEVARALGVPTYYEIDDLIFDSAAYPEPFETYGSPTRRFYESLQIGVPLFRAAMSLCDFGIASTTALAQHMRSVVRKGEVFVLPNGLDDLNTPFLANPPRRIRRDDSVVIFYGSGTQAHNLDFMTLAAPGLVKVMTEDRRVKLMVLGSLSLDSSFDAVRGQIITVGWSDLEAYWSLLAEADIAVAVLAPFATTDAKSELKWIEAATMSIPAIVSGTARYKEVLENNVDALIADSPDEWEAALRRLIGDPELRHWIAARAREKVANRYSIEANAKILASIIPPPAAGRAVRKKRRILLVNVFFHPQSLGGSPRVVKDNLDCFLDGEAGRDFDFAVATTDVGGEGMNQIRVENYRGCPVFRVSPLSSVNIMWQPDLPEMARVFSDILSVWHPDLVHFNCVQKFSGSIVEVCRLANIPYVVTLHDAWWISDWHFLTDSKDRLRDPGEWLPFDPPDPISVGAAVERRRFLNPLLEGAQAILGVSESFAKLHRSCGFAETVAVPNGLPIMKKTSRRSSKSGRVRLAHIGGLSKFKGYFLVEAAFRQRNFNNIELTVVDGSRYGGRELLHVWGNTPVRIVGKMVSENMHEFYADHDVLLAPSLWPEAFGLVAREALAAGLWVVASDRGGIGEDILPNVNGWIIDVGTPEGLLDVLAQIDAEPTRYLSSPKPTRLRTSQEQADDLLDIYRKVLANPRRPERPYARGTVGRELPEATKPSVARRSPFERLPGARAGKSEGA